MSTKSTKGATAADVAAAIALGTMDPSTVMLTADEVAAIAPAPIEIGAEHIAQRSGTEHVCDVPGCRHGAAHAGTKQPDRQVKLACPTCGAVARMTGTALARALGITCMKDGAAFVPAERRTYTRKGN